MIRNFSNFPQKPGMVYLLIVKFFARFAQEIHMTKEFETKQDAKDALALLQHFDGCWVKVEKHKKQKDIEKYGIEKFLNILDRPAHGHLPQYLYFIVGSSIKKICKE